eukprot:scaffold49244_cov52-Attheya_sp.AAC.4
MILLHSPAKDSKRLIRTINRISSRPIQVQSENTFIKITEILNGPILLDKEQPMLEPMKVGWDVPEEESIDPKWQPMHEWHTYKFPSCNRMHEIDMSPVRTSFSILACGGSRCAFRVLDNNYGHNNTREPLVLKTQKYHKDVNSDHLEVGAKDSIIMEALTKSPYIANVYGYCGLSQMVEYSTGGELRALIRKNNLAEEDAIDPIDNLKISIQVASAMSDLHDESISVAHGDLSVDQIILIDGIYKLNDFHLSEFLFWDNVENKTSKDRIGFVGWLTIHHAPEEFKKQPADLEKADVYMMGNVLYNIYTKEWLFDGEDLLEPERDHKEDKQKMLKGERSPFPTYLDTTIRANNAMQWAILQAWVHDPELRPKARYIRDFLLKELSAIEGKTYTPDTVIRVSLP